MHLHNLVHRVFFSFQYFWWHGKNKKKNSSKKSEMQETLERGWDFHVNRICIWFSWTKLKRKKRKFKRFGIITKVFSHELKEPYFTGMNLRGCLASFFTFAGELNFTNNEKKFLEINLILYFSFCSYLLYFKNKKLFVRHVNQILRKIFSFHSAQLRDFYCCQNKNFNVNISKKEILQENFHGWIKRKPIYKVISVLAQNKNTSWKMCFQRTLKTTSECTF